MRKYKLIDLFSGCGGISEGFRQTEKIEVVGAIDFDKYACDTYARNFPGAIAINGDITQIDVAATNFNDIDIIVGGPPCQGLSGLNRWNKDAENDPRNILFLEFVRFVIELKPKAVLLENVRQILTSKNGFAKNKITETLGQEGYNVYHAVLDASDFGVPQKRNRAFFVGIRKDIGEFDFKNLEKYYSEKVTVGDAISDLVEIEEDAKKSESGNELLLGEPKSKYQEQMRHYNKISNHGIFYPGALVRNRIKHVPEGGNWKSVPEELLQLKRRNKRTNHLRENRHSNYLRRLDSSTQSITIDTGHNVYFHPIYDRVPTARECARIQSFPDRFVFEGNRVQQLKQVGNAVPPLLAKALANAILEVIENATV